MTGSCFSFHLPPWTRHSPTHTHVFLFSSPPIVYAPGETGWGCLDVLLCGAAVKNKGHHQSCSQPSLCTGMNNDQGSVVENGNNRTQSKTCDTKGHFAWLIKCFNCDLHAGESQIISMCHIYSNIRVIKSRINDLKLIYLLMLHDTLTSSAHYTAVTDCNWKFGDIFQGTVGTIC